MVERAPPEPVPPLQPVPPVRPVAGDRPPEQDGGHGPPERPMSALDGRVAVVTGGARGIGAAIAS
ncbi:MAG: short chain dehydrogenase, partial [Acidimicrobiales bacterium]